MEMNWWLFFVAALIPLAVGSVWYSPIGFAKSWMKESGVTQEMAESGNMPMIFGLSYLFGLFIAGALMSMVIHQSDVYAILSYLPDFNDATSKTAQDFAAFMNDYGHLHRSFGHGALHGAFCTLTFAFPLIAINSMFERKSWKYIWIHAGYWLVTLMLMGGLICQFL